MVMPPLSDWRRQLDQDFGAPSLLGFQMRCPQMTYLTLSRFAFLMYHSAISEPPLDANCVSARVIVAIHPRLVRAHEIDSAAAGMLISVEARGVGAVAPDLADAAGEGSNARLGAVDGDGLARPDGRHAGRLVPAVLACALAAAHEVGRPDAAQARGPALAVASPPAVAAGEGRVLARRLRAAHLARGARALRCRAAAGTARRGPQADTCC